MATTNYRMNRADRDQLVKTIADKLNRGVPQKVVMRWVLHTTKYTYQGARGLFTEANIRRSEPEPNKQESLST